MRQIALPMSADLSSPDNAPYDESISSGGFRLTKQRREVYDVLLGTRDHPSAVQVFNRVQRKMPTISLATVYNCLETLTQVGLVQQVNFDRGPSRFCPNTQRHAHFICTRCGRVHDMDLPDEGELSRLWQLPEDYVVNHYEFSLRGLCRSCVDDPASAADPSSPTT